MKYNSEFVEALWTALQIIFRILLLSLPVYLLIWAMKQNGRTYKKRMKKRGYYLQYEDQNRIWLDAFLGGLMFFYGMLLLGVLLDFLYS